MSVLGKVADCLLGVGFAQVLLVLLGLGLLLYWSMTKDYGKLEAQGLYSIKPDFFYGNQKPVLAEGVHFMDFHQDYYKKTEGHK